MEAHAISVEKVEFAAARGRFEAVVDRLRGTEALALTHSELEAMIEVDGREVLRLLLQDHLDLRRQNEVQHPSVTGADGVERGHHRERARPLMTVFGPVTVLRTGYGARGHPSLHPVDAQLNLPEELYSHGVRKRLVEEVARGSYDESVGALERNTGAAVPKRQAEQLAVRAAADFDDFYSARRAASAAEEEKSGELVVLTSDGKGVRMRKEHLREATRKAAEESQHRMKKRLSKGEKNHRKRMSTVASVFTLKPFVRTAEDVVAELRPVKEVKDERPRPEKKRVWACIAKEVGLVIQDVFGEAIRRDPARQKRWVALVDGNKPQLELLNEQAKKFGVELTIVLDIIHVLEYLWKAAWAFHREGEPAAENWVSERLLQVLRGESSAVAGGIRRSATLRRLRGQSRKAADKTADYLLKYGPYLRYDEYLAAGLPIATGVVEGACRYLVKDRLDVTGAHWSLNGAEAVLRLRSLRASGDFEAYWRFHLKRERSRNHDVRYAEPIPQSSPSPANSRGHLQMVKRS